MTNKVYLLDGFNTQEQAIQKIDNLTSHFSSNQYRVVARVEQMIQGFYITVPEEAIRFLSIEEKARLIEEPQNIQFSEYAPIAYRFIGEKHVDEFFETGTLRLSTFKRCKKLEDKNRKDESEGRAILVGKEKDLRMELDMGAGDNAILLCTSLSINNIKADGQKDDSCIEIRDINSFTLSITNALLQQGYPIKAVLKGPCVYSNRHIEKELGGDELKNFLDDMQKSNRIDFGRLISLGSQISENDIFFCKPIENRYENEYRVLWLLGNDVTRETYDVSIPDARKHCRKIKFDIDKQ